MKKKPVFLNIEYALSAAIVGGLAYSFWFLFTYFRFPQPFFYDVGDTWMDWFNPAYWSHQPGTYDSYKTIYPPLTYAILKYITWAPCYANAQGGWSRDCDILGIAALHLTYVICIIVTALSLKKIDKATSLPRSLALTMGLPMMWGLDRGNVILITYIFVVLAFGPLVKSAIARWIFAGLAINMKVYLVGVIAAQLLHRRWKWAEGAIIATIAVYCVSFAIFGAGTPSEIFENITAYSDGLVINNPLDVWMASTLLPLRQLANSQVFPTTLVIGSRNVDLIDQLVPIIMISAQAIIAASAAFCFIRPESVPRHRMVAISIGLAIMSTEVSSYTQILVIFFCFMEPAKTFLLRYAIITCYLVCIPFDINIDSLPPIVKESFFFQKPIIIEYVIQIGPFIRPILTLSIPVALALQTINDVWRDIHSQGWAQRWRFRRDTPFLPAVMRPVPPRRPHGGAE